MGGVGAAHPDESARCETEAQSGNHQRHRAYCKKVGCRWRDCPDVYGPHTTAHAVDLEVRVPDPLYVGLQAGIAPRPHGSLTRIGALRRMVMIGAWGEGGKDSTCNAGGKPAEGIGRT